MLRALTRNFFRLMLSLVVACALAWPGSLQADQAQYFYDELGRLVGVVDGNGDVAVYNYDAVGNLLSIERFGTGSTGIGIFLLAPGSAVVGTDVEIGGFGFSATPTDNQVDFNGTAATVVSAEPAKLVATVPSGATTGPVTVTNTNGTATSPQPFTVLVPPIIVSIDPATVPRGTTTQAIVGGFNLTDATAVTFTEPGITASFFSGATNQDLRINLTVGSGVATGSYAFSVTTPAGTAQSGTVAVAVEPAVPSLGLFKGSVFLPFPAQTPPQGLSQAVSPPVSVAMP